jgi:hypothetical protein
VLATDELDVSRLILIAGHPDHQYIKYVDLLFLLRTESLYQYKAIFNTPQSKKGNLG